MADIEMAKGDREKSITGNLQMSDGTAIDLTGSTVAFYMWDRETRTLKISGSAVTITSTSTGGIQYDWAASDVDTGGRFEGQFRITTSAGKLQTVPNDSYIDIEFTEPVA